MTTAVFKWKVFGTASFLASSIVIVVLVAQRPVALGGAPSVETSETLAHIAR